MAIPADTDDIRLPMTLVDGRCLVVLKSRGGMVQYYRDPDLAEAARDSDRGVLLLDKQIAVVDLPWWERLVTLVRERHATASRLRHGVHRFCSPVPGG